MWVYLWFNIGTGGGTFCVKIKCTEGGDDQGKIGKDAYGSKK